MVTGAGSGIGRATVQRFLAEGANVVAVDILSERLEALALEADTNALLGVRADVGDAAEHETATNSVAMANEYPFHRDALVEGVSGPY